MTYESVNPQDVARILATEENVVLLDVRTISEHERIHIPGDVHIPLDDMEERYVELDKNKKIIVYCASGNRSRMACEFLSHKGFSCINMIGGIGMWHAVGNVVE